MMWYDFEHAQMRSKGQDFDVTKDLSFGEFLLYLKNAKRYEN